MRFRQFTGLAAAAMIALAPAPRAALAESREAIVVYNAQHASLTQAWADAFTKDTGIGVTLRQGSDTELGNQLVQEGAASPADVFITENSPAMALVDKAGLFAPLSAATLALVPAPYRPADGKWIGIAARTTVFAYNKAKLTPDELPQSLLDLAAASWRGRWGASPSSADFQAIVGALLQLKGEAATAAWLRAEKANSVAYRGNTAVLRAVNIGEIDGGIIYHYYYFGDQAKTGENSNNVALHYFRNGDPGAFVSVSGAGVLASSKHKAAAEAFVAWIAGKSGQAILRDGDSYEYPVGSGVAANPKLEPLGGLGAPAVEPQGLDSKKVVELMIAADLL
jgi:iron(III) transport system substrate-binding protein